MPTKIFWHFRQISNRFITDISPTFRVSETLICREKYKNYDFIARIIILFVHLHYRNYRYGNEYYDKAYRYEIF